MRYVGSKNLTSSRGKKKVFKFLFFKMVGVFIPLKNQKQ